MTLPTQLVLRVLVADPDREMYGFEIGHAAGLASGTVHPILARLEAVGWLESHWEPDLDPRAEGRPRRRYYRLTPDGAQRALASLAAVGRPSGLVGRLIPAIEGGSQ